MAGQHRTGRRRPGRLLSRGAPRPGRDARLHLDARRSGDRPARGVRPHRLGAALVGHHGEPEPVRRRGRRRGRRRCRRAPVPVRPPRRRVDARRRTRSVACAGGGLEPTRGRQAPLVVTFHAPGQSGEQVRLVRHRANGRHSSPCGEAHRPVGDPRRPGHLRFEARLKPGRYDARLTSTGGRTLSHTPFWVYTRGSHATVDHVATNTGSGSRSRWTGLVHPAWVWTGSASSAAIA